jgi:repressor LexA
MLTDRQQQIWNYLVEYVDSHGYPPTVREIGEQVGLASPSTVHAHLANLERAGLLRRDPTKPRALELIGRERSQPVPGAQPATTSVPAWVEEAGAVRLPLVGQIAAGAPLLAEQNIEDYLPMPKTTGGDFLLRVRGDSMIGAGILDGDLVIVQRQQDARNGEIVVALAGDDETADEATVKTFYREEQRIRLQPENAALEPIYAEHVQILGRVVGVFREL